MHIYKAIMAAADTIEQRPAEYDFDQCLVPRGVDCGTPGCALGWIGFHAGRREMKTHHDVAQDILLIDHFHFYDRMDALAPGWRRSAHICAKGLRLYAAKYHAPKGLPDAVREIFTQPALGVEGAPMPSGGAEGTKEDDAL